MSDLVGKHIVGFPTRRLILDSICPGHCGFYNLYKADDLTLRDGSTVGKAQSNAFGNDWAILTGTYRVLTTGPF